MSAKASKRRTPSIRRTLGVLLAVIVAISGLATIGIAPRDAEPPIALSEPRLVAAQDEACPGGPYDDDFPCLGDLLLEDDAGFAHRPVRVYEDPDKRRLITPSRTRVFELGIDTPSGVPTPIRSFRLPVDAVGGTFYDDAHRILYTAGDPEGVRCTGATSQVDCFTNSYQIGMLDLDDGRSAVVDLPEEHAGLKPRAFAFDPRYDALYTFTSHSYPAGKNPVTQESTLHAFRLVDDGSTLDLEHRWAYRMRGCLDVVPTGGNVSGVMDVGEAGNFVYLACDGTLAVDRQSRLNGVVKVHFGTEPGDDPTELDTDEVGDPTASPFEYSFTPFPGRTEHSVAEADRRGDRLILPVIAASDKRVYVFDATENRWSGSRPIVAANVGGVAVDRATGRAYVADADTGDDTGTAYLIDAASVPVPSGVTRPLGMSPLLKRPMAFDPVHRRLYAICNAAVCKDAIRTYEDRTKPPERQDERDPDDSTRDIDEDEAGVVTHTAEASAYGARLTTTSEWGGTDVWRTAVVDNDAQLDGDRSASSATALARGFAPGETNEDDLRDLGFGEGVPRPHRTADGAISVADRSLIDAASPVEGVQSGLESLFEPFRGPRDDFREGDPSQSCDAPGEQLDRAFAEAFSESPNPDERREPAEGRECDERESHPDSADAHYQDRAPLKEMQEARCDDPGSRMADGEPGSLVACDGSGHHVAAAAWFSDDMAWRTADEQGLPVRVGYSESTTSMQRLEDGGVVAESRSIARGVDLSAPGVGGIHIGEIRSLARAEAAGRPGTAQSSHTVSINQVRITDAEGTVFACGWDTESDVNTVESDESAGTRADDPGGRCDPSAVVAALNRAGRAYPVPVQFELIPRDDDPEVRGSDGGARASITKDPFAFASDDATFGDDSREIPALRITAYHEYDNVFLTRQETREILDLAAVRTETLYQIGAPTPEGFEPGPASLSVELVDGDDAPLAGGQFEVSGESAPFSESCTTGEDGVGDCRFDQIEPGEYSIRQTAAPGGYIPSSETAIASVFLGGEAAVRFVNLEAVGTVSVELLDARTGGPLAGGSFELYSDDGDQTLSPNDRQLVGCTTGSNGACAFGDVPLGAYVLHQAGAPEGYERSDDIAFSLTNPGQHAAVRVVNGRDGSVAGVELVSSSGPVGPSTRVDVPGSGGGWALRQLGDAARYLIRNPIQALLFGLFWTLIGAPVYLAARRRDLQLSKEMF